MNSEIDGSAEVTSSRRRSSTVGSTGLGYSSCHSVEEDINCRIRSLLLSRNHHRPPKTPFPSDECNNYYFEAGDRAAGLDFIAARSVVKLARQQTGRLNTPETWRLVSKSDEMEPRRPTRPNLPSLKLLPHLRRSSSANNLKVPVDDTIKSPSTLNADPDLPAETKARFRLPKLVLQDKPKRSRKIRSCIEINPSIPADDVRIHETELLCCPPCDPNESPKSVYTTKYPKWPGGAVRAVPGDLACFLAGCPSSHLECERHHRRRESIPVRESIMGRQIGDDFVGVAEGLKHDIARLGHSLRDVRVWSPHMIPAPKNRPDAQQASSTVERPEALSSHKQVTFDTEQRDFGSDGGRVMPTTDLRSPSEYSEICSSITSTSDAFPHAYQSLELVTKESLPECFSTTVSTNFSLPGYKTKRGSTKEYFTSSQLKQDDPNKPTPRIEGPSSPGLSIRFISSTVSPTDGSPKVTVHSKQSGASLSSKSRPPSLLSGGSRSSVRHALLKPSVTETQPVDIGLPIPPMLSPIESISEQSMPEVPRYREKLKAALDLEPAESQHGTAVLMAPVIPPLESDLEQAVPEKSACREHLEDAVAAPVQPVDIRIPVPAMQSAAADFSEQMIPVAGSGMRMEEEVEPAVTSDESNIQLQNETAVQLAMVSPVVRHATTVQNAEHLVRSIQSRVERVKVEAQKLVGSPSHYQSSTPALVKGEAAVHPSKIIAPSLQAGSSGRNGSPAELATAQQLVSDPSRPKSPPPSLVKFKAAMEAPQITAASPKPESPHPHVSTTETKNPTSAKMALSTSLIVGCNHYASPEQLSAVSQAPGDSFNAAYWRFVPVVKEAVQDAVQLAVRNAVHEIVVPAGVEKDAASDACRRLVANSLAEAAKNADDYLRNVSLWNEQPSPTRASESTVICLSRNVAGEQTDYPISVVGDPCAETPRRTSVASKENDGGKAIDSSKSLPRPVRNGQTGNVAANSRICDNEFLGDEMETVPLEQDEKPLAKSKKKPPRPWRNGTPFGYDAIPTRKSSRNRVLSPKKPGTNTRSDSEKASRTRPFQRLVSRASPILRSVSSEGSLNQDREGENPLLHGNKLDRCSHRRSASHDPLEEVIGQKNTVQWLKNLFSNSDPYEPRFTALPPRNRRVNNVSGAPLRCQRAPAKPVAELSLGTNSKPAEDDQRFVKDQISTVKREYRAGPPETFARTINDLENLMNEALNIARQAADNQDAGYVPAVLVDAAKVLKTGRDRYMARLSKTCHSDEDSAAPSIHESLRDLSDSDVCYHSDEPDTYEEQFEVTNDEVGRTLTASLNSPAKHAAGGPPTGRVTTPYPPLSKPPSTDSHSPSAEGVDQVVVADHRSLPTETDLVVPRRLSVPDAVEPDIANEDNDIWDDPKPEFRTLQPFSNPTSLYGTRKSSSKSPKRLSPTRQTQSGPAPVIPQDLGPLPKLTSRNSDLSRRYIQDPHSEEEHQAVKSKLASKSVPSKQEVRDYIMANRNPPIQPRSSSRNLRKLAEKAQGRNLISSQRTQTVQTGQTGQTYAQQNVNLENKPAVSEADGEIMPQEVALQSAAIDQLGYAQSFDGSQITRSEEVDFNTGFGVRHRNGGEPSRSGAQQGIELQDEPDPNLPQTSRMKKRHAFSLRGKNHVSLNEHHHKGFSLARSHKRQSIARDWSPGRKRFVASVACFSTALIGILVGIYAGETPAIQYYIVDFHHYTVLGNVFFFIGLAIPTFLFWPLPLLHGRKPYILGSMSLAMPLLFPQALAVGQFRSPYVATWRVGLILPRAAMGFCLGFANMNFKSMLTDLFGASLQSTNPHQEHVDEFDVRRHGGGMGIWLGLWTWSALGSIGLGFLIGAIIVNHLPPAWGFYVSITIIAFIMLLNVLCPEVRRSAFRRSVAEVVNGQEVSRRLARGEVKMHMVQSGPKWWGEEFHYGIMLSMNMLRQPGFLVMALYVAWTYGQMVLNILLLGALMSKDYKFKSPEVGASVMAIPLGAFLSIPFQKASLFSRARSITPISDDGTLKKKLTWTSHMVRRSIFMLVLPFAGLGYTLSASGPPVPFSIPILFAGLIGFLSNLAMAECHGIIMETFDTSDLQPGMTGRSRGSSGDKTASKRTNYSSFPRVTSAFAITQGFGYLIAAAASGVGGVLTRHLGQQAACGIMAAVLLILSLLLLGVLIRFTDVQIIPDSKKDEMDRYHNARRTSALRREEGVKEEEPWRPIIIGNPHHHTRRMCLLELGSLSRFSEIRKKNKLVDEKSLEAKHPNRAAVEALEHRIKEKELEVMHHVRRSLSRGSSRASRISKLDAVPEQGDLGGHREMINSRGNSGNGRGRGRGVQYGQ